MTIESLDAAIKDQPFVPFSLRLADGRVLPVPHPEFIAFTGRGRTAVVMADDDRFVVVDLLLVLSLDFEQTKAVE